MAANRQSRSEARHEAGFHTGLASLQTAKVQRDRSMSEPYWNDVFFVRTREQCASASTARPGRIWHVRFVTKCQGPIATPSRSCGRPTNGRFRKALMAVPTTVLGRKRDGSLGWISAGPLPSGAGIKADLAVPPVLDA